MAKSFVPSNFCQSLNSLLVLKLLLLLWVTLQQVTLKLQIETFNAVSHFKSVNSFMKIEWERMKIHFLNEKYIFLPLNNLSSSLLKSQLRPLLSGYTVNCE